MLQTTPNVSSIAKAGSTPLSGATTLTGGTNVTLTQSGQDISIEATGGAGVPTTITVANEATDTTCFPLFVTAATGDLSPKTSTTFAFDSSNIRLGVGVAAPSVKIEVVGSTNALEGIKITNSSAGASAQSTIACYNNSTAAVTFGAVGSNYSGYGIIAANEGFFYSTKNLDFMVDDAAGYIKFATGGNAEKMRIAANGRVGIGVGGAPDSMLHVVGRIQQGGTTGVAGYLQTNSSALASTTDLNPGVAVYGGGAAESIYGMDVGYTSSSTRYNTRIFTYNGGDIALATHASSPPSAQSHFTNRVVVRGDTGNVGIGTAAPSTLLHVGLAGTTLGTFGLAGNTSGLVTIQPAAAAGTWTMTLPTNDGDANQFLQTNGSGVTTWASASGFSKLSETTLGSAATSVTCSSFASVSYLHIVITGTGFSAGDDIEIVFNSDTGTNYGQRRIANQQGAGSANASQNAARLGTAFWDAAFSADIWISNIATKIKHGKSEVIVGDSGSSPTMYEAGILWYDTTNAITTVKIQSVGGATFDTGTTLTIYGV